MKSLLREGRRWRLASPPDEDLVKEIQLSLGCARAFAAVLAQRGCEAWPRLIDPGERHLHPPDGLLDMAVAVARLTEAVERGERVFIHGDFDVDGLTGAAVLYRGLHPLLPKGSMKVDVGDRQRGHGLSRAFVRRVIDEGFHLVITADCGVTNLEEIAALRDAGIDTIVTDHHIPPPNLPPALAIVDPHRPEERYPNRHLAGVGVAYKLICAFYKHLQRSAPDHLLDLVALGTIADLVPLSDGGEVENRAMVRAGFSLIAQGTGSSLGLRAIIERLSVNPKRLSAADIGYVVAPKLNAANRAGDPKVAFLLLTTSVPERAEYLIEALLDYNRDREIAQEDLIAQAEERMAEEGNDPRQDGVVFVVGTYWNEGVLGLAASNLADRYGVPAVVVSQGDRVSRGSCRSVTGFDMMACLETHAELLVQYGGHEMAAGFSAANEVLPVLKERLSAYVHQWVPPAGGRAGEIDSEVSAEEIDLRFYTNIRSLAPYGPGNAAPRFMLRSCAFEDLTLVGARRQHLKGKLVQDGLALPFIAFRMGRHLTTFEGVRGASLVFRAGFDDWRSDVQVEAVDLVEE